MNQIKYILSACLIFLMISAAIFLYKTFPDSGIIAQDQTIIENVSSTTSTTANSKGEQLFKQNCAACHALDKELIGPALHGIAQRGPWAEDKQNLKKWIKNPGSFIAADPYGKQLKEKYKITMPKQDQLSDADIEVVIDYIAQ